MNRATVLCGAKRALITSLPLTRRYLVELHCAGRWIGTWTATSFHDAAQIALRITSRS